MLYFNGSITTFKNSEINSLTSFSHNDYCFTLFESDINSMLNHGRKIQYIYSFSGVLLAIINLVISE